MVAETGEEWPSKLQATVLAANTIRKKSIKFTPFFLMYGREANCAHLLELNRIEESEPQQPSDDNAPPTNEQDDWVGELIDIRDLSREAANDNIRDEQLLQKRAFDSKVKKNM